jgi:hypothetical protein
VDEADDGRRDGRARPTGSADIRRDLFNVGSALPHGAGYSPGNRCSSGKPALFGTEQKDSRRGRTLRSKGVDVQLGSAAR